jgi:UDP-glucose 4-epimerase
MALRAYHKEHGMKTSAVRIFSAYGPRENETHAVISLIARAFIRADPFVIWGTGEQDRNFTYVQDIVDALVLVAEKIEDGYPINAGRDDRITINEAAELIFSIVKWRPQKIVHDLEKPQGVASRATNLEKAEKLLGWRPKVDYREGFEKTIKWYSAHKNKDQIRSNLEKLLIER